LTDLTVMLAAKWGEPTPRPRDTSILRIDHEHRKIVLNWVITKG